MMDTQMEMSLTLVDLERRTEAWMMKQLGHGVAM
jgi:hypothetical protein